MKIEKIFMLLMFVLVSAAVATYFLRPPAETSKEKSATNKLSSTKTSRTDPKSSKKDNADSGNKPFPEMADFYGILIGDPAMINLSLANLDQDWQPGYFIMLVETVNVARDEGALKQVVDFLQRKTGQQIGVDFRAWYRWIWNQDFRPHPKYGNFKAWLYSEIAKNFSEYFSDERKASIRLDEIRWGGVPRDGIPPLKNPEMISVEQATYLEDSNVVFGISINGDVRAYPKRILAWHEMFKDTVGDVSINGVYCTLCGSMIVYETVFDGKHYELGTSGFLYRSNKLMYDHETKSMWSTLAGKPVVGPLVDKGIQLKRGHVVTTTWGEWKKLHPDTTVLSLNTGHDRDYGEGVAYRDYFATDKLMFGVPKTDQRLKNKDEILALVFEGDRSKTMAISAQFLLANRVYHDNLGKQNFVVVTDSSGANRVYATDGQKFDSVEENDSELSVVDSEGAKWTLTEASLNGPAGAKLERLPAHRAFWFGWQAVYPDTRLVK